MRIRNYIIAVFYLICVSTALGQVELNFDFDYARFKYDSASVYLEFYYNLNPVNMVQTDYETGKKLFNATSNIR